MGRHPREAGRHRETGLRWHIVHAAFDRGHNQLRQALETWLAVSGTSLLLFAAVWVASRRAAGAMETPPRSAALLGTALVAIALARVTHATWQARRRQRESPLPYVGRGLISLAILVLGIGLSVPAVGMAVLLPFWLILLLSETSAWAALPRLRSAVAPPAVPMPVVQVSVEPACTSRPESLPEVATPCPAPEHHPAASANSRPDEDVLQRQVRRRAGDGSEELSGFARIALAAGQRMTSLHVAFCPPFVRSPEVRLEQIGGPEAKVKKMQVLPYGARFDLRLVDPCEEGATILVQWSAQCGLRHGVSGT